MTPLRVRERIASLEELRGVIRAMRALAAQATRDAEASLDGVRRYAAVVEDAIGQAALLLPETADDDPAEPPQGPAVTIALCSEHGFVGGYNGAVLDRAARAGAARSLAVVGTRGWRLAEERRLAVTWRFPMAAHLQGILGVTRAIATRLADCAAADIVYAHHGRGGRYDVVERRILPLDPALLAAAGGPPPLHHLDAPRLLADLAREYLLAEITRAAVEALASENGARLQAMEAADRNIGDALDDLRLTANALRQQTITDELLDVVVGAEAVGVE